MKLQLFQFTNLCMYWFTSSSIHQSVYFFGVTIINCQAFHGFATSLIYLKVYVFVKILAISRGAFCEVETFRKSIREAFRNPATEVASVP